MGRRRFRGLSIINKYFKNLQGSDEVHFLDSGIELENPTINDVDAFDMEFGILWLGNFVPIRVSPDLLSL